VALLTGIRERFLYVGGKLAPELAAKTQAAACAALVDAEIRVILEARCS